MFRSHSSSFDPRFFFFKRGSELSSDEEEAKYNQRHIKYGACDRRLHGTHTSTIRFPCYTFIYNPLCKDDVDRFNGSILRVRLDTLFV